MSDAKYRQRFEKYLSILLDGNSIDFRNKVSICLINDYYERKVGGRYYQVHCDDSRFQCSQLYKRPRRALEKFLEIRNKLRKRN